MISMIVFQLLIIRTIHPLLGAYVSEPQSQAPPHSEIDGTCLPTIDGSYNSFSTVDTLSPVH